MVFQRFSIKRVGSILIVLIALSVAVGVFSVGRLPMTAEFAHLVLYRLSNNVRTNGTTADELVALGNFWEQVGDPSRALPYWQAALAQRPNLPLYRRVVGITLEAGQWDVALTTAQQALGTYADDPWLNLQVGYLLAPSNPDEALRYLARVADNDVATQLMDIIQRNLGEPFHSTSIATTLANAHEYSVAESAYQYANTVHYPYPEAMAQIAYMRDLQGKDGEAWMSQALAFAPDSADVRFVQGLHLRAVGKPEQALEAFYLVLSLQDPNKVIYAEIARTYDTMGLTDYAQEWTQKAEALPN